jgi:lysozyme
MKLNNDGYRLISKHEGLRLKPYLCPAKIPTIGYGNTYYPDVNGTRVTLLDKEITEQQAFDMFKEIADRFAKKVSRLVTSPINQNQFNALVSFSYNVGLANFMKSTLLKKVNADPNDFDIRLEFAKWNKAGGVKSNGLVNRRSEESALYYTAN